jgi:micrococcal nuclease
MENMTPLYRATALTLLVFAALLAWCSPACSSVPPQATWWGVVTYVVDGDTVHVRPVDGGKPVSIRVDGIDAPEICQPGVASSRDALKQRALGQRVAVHGRLHDDYGRLLARIVLNDEDLGEWMVAQGLAWSYRYSNNAGPYAVEQRRAKAAGLGLFSRVHAASPVYPRAFRKQHGSCYF